MASVGPDGHKSNNGDGTLYARIGSNNPFRVGSNLEFEAEKDGPLTLAMNSPGEGTGHNDDHGSLKVTVEILDQAR